MNRDQRRHILVGPVAIGAVLMLFLLATALYAFLPGAPDKAGVSISIGAMKAVVIAALFMQLRRAAGLVRMAAVVGLAWTSFLYLFAFSDYLTR